MSKTLTKLQLAEHVHEEIGLQLAQSVCLVQFFIDAICDNLIEGDDVKLSGFGKFSVAEKSPRRGRNPQTGEAITITARRIVGFKPSPVLRSKINQT